MQWFKKIIICFYEQTDLVANGGAVVAAEPEPAAGGFAQFEQMMAGQ